MSLLLVLLFIYRKIDKLLKYSKKSVVIQSQIIVIFPYWLEENGKPSKLQCFIGCVCWICWFWCWWNETDNRRMKILRSGVSRQQHSTRWRSSKLVVAHSPHLSTALTPRCLVCSATVPLHCRTHSIQTLPTTLNVCHLHDSLVLSVCQCLMDLEWELAASRHCCCVTSVASVWLSSFSCPPSWDWTTRMNLRLCIWHQP